MQRVAVLDNHTNIVREIVNAGPHWKAPDGYLAIESDLANEGDFYNGEEFVPVEKSLPKADLLACAKRRHLAVMRGGFTFDIAGLDGAADIGPTIVRIPATAEYRDQIIEQAYLAQTDAWGPYFLALPDRTIKVTPQQIIAIRHMLARHVTRATVILAQLNDAINAGKVTSRAEIDFPETATAIKLQSWFVE